MKILVIMGSPRKGNTVRILEEIELEMKKLGDVEFSTIALKDVPLRCAGGATSACSKGRACAP
jgi:multimeric flavodoxin WrbA